MTCGAENESDCSPAVSLVCQWGGAKIFHAGLTIANNIGVGDIQLSWWRPVSYENGLDVKLMDRYSDAPR